MRNVAQAAGNPVVECRSAFGDVREMSLAQHGSAIVSFDCNLQDAGSLRTAISSFELLHAYCKKPRFTLEGCEKGGDPRWARTTDILLRRQVLYPAELRGLDLGKHFASRKRSRKLPVLRAKKLSFNASSSAPVHI